MELRIALIMLLLTASKAISQELITYEIPRQYKYAIHNDDFTALAIENDHSKYWCENLELKSISRDTVADSWEPAYGKKSVVRNRYNELILYFNIEKSI